MSAGQSEKGVTAVSMVSMEKESIGKKLESFGVYLGTFAANLTSNQARLLQLWDVIVLDPFAEGVVATLQRHPMASSQVLARVDLVGQDGSLRTQSDRETVMALDNLFGTLSTLSRIENARFTGILLAGFSTHIQPLLLNKVVEHINTIGLDVWLEIAYPDYLTADECSQINFHSIRGVVYRNATIDVDGCLLYTSPSPRD